MARKAENRGSGCRYGTRRPADDEGLVDINPKEVFWYELPRTPRSLTVGVRRLHLPGGVMNQVSATKNRGVKA